MGSLQLSSRALLHAILMGFQVLFGGLVVILKESEELGESGVKSKHLSFAVGGVMVLVGLAKDGVGGGLLSLRERSVGSCGLDSFPEDLSIYIV